VASGCVPNIGNWLSLDELSSLNHFKGNHHSFHGQSSLISQTIITYYTGYHHAAPLSFDGLSSRRWAIAYLHAVPMQCALSGDRALAGCEAMHCLPAQTSVCATSVRRLWGESQRVWCATSLGVSVSLSLCLAVSVSLSAAVWFDLSVRSPPRHSRHSVSRPPRHNQRPARPHGRAGDAPGTRRDMRE
jgi:hypothetical protein